MQVLNILKALKELYLCKYNQFLYIKYIILIYNYLLFKNDKAMPKAKSKYSKRAGDLESICTRLQYQVRTHKTIGK